MNAGIADLSDAQLGLRRRQGASSPLRYNPSYTTVSLLSIDSFLITALSLNVLAAEASLHFYSSDPIDSQSAFHTRLPSPDISGRVGLPPRKHV
jgi:hypothetical protein